MGAVGRAFVAGTGAAVAALRERFRAERAAGLTAIECCRHAADACDSIVVSIWDDALGGLDEEARRTVREGVALVAVGGSGRRCTAPFSDVDLCLLHRPGAAPHVPAIARRLLQDLFDAGLEVGQSVRTPEEALALAAEDASIFTALCDGRHLAGAADILPELAAGLAGLSAVDPTATARRLLAARRTEVARHGGSVALLEPNVKRSAGGLRDIHLLRWLGRVLHGEPSLEGLAARSILSAEDVRGVAAAEEFLLGLRVDMHLAAGKAGDDLSRAEQQRLAEARGYPPRPGLLPVEQFMQAFFGHARHVGRVLETLLPEDRPEPGVGEGAAPRREGPFVVGPHDVGVAPEELGRVADAPDAVVRLVDLAARRGLPVARGTWRAVRGGRAGRDEGLDAGTAAAFLGLFEHPHGLGRALRGLHEVGVLARIVPPFAHARDLLQFNNYHKYTVDEHCILAVERAAASAEDPGWLGAEWRLLTRKRPLLLALLLHDLGKGFPEDHSVLGARLARDVTARLGLPDDEREIVEFLVLEHLTMAHLAFRRDADDDSLVVPFARRVGSPEILRMMSLLTAADVAAVGPGTWTRWKEDVLAGLHYRTLAYLDSDAPGRADGRRREAISDAARNLAVDDGTRDLLERLPRSALAGMESERVVAEVARLAALAPGGVLAAVEWLPATGTVGITVGTRGVEASTAFQRVTGALLGERLSILAADFHPLGEGSCVGRFTTLDGDFAGEPPADRLAEIGAAIRGAMRAESPPTFPRRWNPFAPRVTPRPPRVLVDNASSARTTILEVFADDAEGLLHGIAGALAAHGLVVRSARIATHLDQVVDAFHVTDAAGGKVTDPRRLAEVREALERAASPVTRPS